jgi:hypothetical protein
VMDVAPCHTWLAWSHIQQAGRRAAGQAGG